MEAVELKLRLINKSEFVLNYTKKVVEILKNPQMNLEVKAGKICEDVSNLVESMGYNITARREMDDWIRLTAVKQN